MKKKAINVSMVIAVIVIALILGYTIIPSFAADNVASNKTAEVVNPETSDDAATALEGKKIFLYNAFTGVILSDDEIASLLKQSEAKGITYSTFIALATTGEEITDPMSGMTFVVHEGKDYVNLSNGADIYEVGSNLGQLLNSFDQNDFRLDRQIKSSYGTFNLYRRA